MRKVALDFSLCDRIVRHVDSLRGLLPQEFTNLVFALFGRRWTEIMLRDASKEVFLTDDIRFSLRRLDAAILDILVDDDSDLPEEMTVKIYKDFGTLKTLIS